MDRRSSARDDVVVEEPHPWTGAWKIPDMAALLQFLCQKSQDTDVAQRRLVEVLLLRGLVQAPSVSRESSDS